jgi:hypothetical protein
MSTLSITSLKVQEELLRLIQFIKKKDVGGVFCTPVDAVKLGLHDYHTIVQTPMDLSTVEVCYLRFFSTKTLEKFKTKKISYLRRVYC